jgi:hypothetical protein
MGIRIVSAISIWLFHALFLRSTFPVRLTHMVYGINAMTMSMGLGCGLTSDHIHIMKIKNHSSQDNISKAGNTSFTLS